MLSNLTDSALGFFAGVGLTICVYRLRGYRMWPRTTGADGAR